MRSHLQLSAGCLRDCSAYARRGLLNLRSLNSERWRKTNAIAVRVLRDDAFVFHRQHKLPRVDGCEEANSFVLLKAFRTRRNRYADHEAFAAHVGDDVFRQLPQQFAHVLALRFAVLVHALLFEHFERLNGNACA